MLSLYYFNSFLFLSVNHSEKLKLFLQHFTLTCYCCLWKNTAERASLL